MEKIKTITPTCIVDLGLLDQLVEPAELDRLAQAYDGSIAEYIGWWRQRLDVKKRTLTDYPTRVALRSVRALIETPRIIIGTGHSVKGGEADVVYPFPDLSTSGMRQWVGSPKDRDAVIRLGYVMMTRARETFVICEPASSYYMPLAAFATRLARGEEGVM